MKGGDLNGQEASTHWKKGSHGLPEFPEKKVAAKPFVKYPYAFYNKYGHVQPVRINPSRVVNTFPRFS